MFKDRYAAGQVLANRLKDIKADLVLGIPRGGVVVASAVAESLRLPLDIVITRKIGAPTQPELALGAVDPDGEVVWDSKLLSQLKLTMYNVQLTIEVERQKQEIKRRENLYRHERSGLAKLVNGKTVILIDDGMATGSTVGAAVNYLKRHGVKKIILGLPVASKEALKRVVEECEEVVVLDTPEYFQAVGQFYQEFQPVSDSEVVKLLQ
ncbi:phosphoribosyltransferase [Candidatus Daviesbacteria bacterium]|nr:phosphoribosyltransferase [Candidatus Daviesbacteria bacterium]